MKNFTLQAVSDEAVYIVVERDDGTTFGKQVPASQLSGDQAQMLAQLDTIAYEADQAQGTPAAVQAVLSGRVGEKMSPRSRPTKEEIQATIETANERAKGGAPAR